MVDHAAIYVTERLKMKGAGFDERNLYLWGEDSPA